jgi:hypothetical protein
VYVHIAFEKVINIQNKILDSHKNSLDRFEILKDLFVRRAMAIQLEIPKKRKAREAHAAYMILVKGITNDVRDAVLARYLRYCKDQFGFNFLSYRRRINESKLSHAETLGLRLRIGMRKGHPIRYRTATGVLVVEPEKLGELMESVIPCLDPALKEKHRTKKAMAVRYDEKQGLAQLEIDC